AGVVVDAAVQNGVGFAAARAPRSFGSLDRRLGPGAHRGRKAAVRAERIEPLDEVVQQVAALVVPDGVGQALGAARFVRVKVPENKRGAGDVVAETLAGEEHAEGRLVQGRVGGAGGARAAMIPSSSAVVSFGPALRAVRASRAGGMP